MTEKLLNNALQSICVGVEDFSDGSPQRLLSAVRNVHSGILLLYKHKLADLSPPESNNALLREKIVPIRLLTGSIGLKGIGRRTARTDQIKERFQNLGIDVDWKRFRILSELRNDVEHYFISDNKKVVVEALSSSFILIDDFIRNQLNEKPATLLGPPCWDVLLETKELFHQLRADCLESLELMSFANNDLASMIENFRCVECGSSLLMANDTDGTDTVSVELECSSCGAAVNLADVVEAVLVRRFEWDSYVATTDGGEEPLKYCEVCGRTSFITEEESCPICDLSNIV